MYTELYGEGVPAELFSVPMNIHMLSNDGGSVGQVKKKNTFLVRISIKKKAGGFFKIYYFLLHAFFTHYYLPPGIRWTLRTMFSLRSNKDADKRRLSILSFLCMKQRRTTSTR